MTEEKAIDLLDNLIGMVEDNHNSDYDTALKMGIKALEQEPTTKNDLGVEECISRKAALDACHNFAIGVLDDYYEKCLKQWIINLPLITPQEPCVYYDAFNKTCRRSEVPQEPILDKIKTDIAKFADTIPFVSGDIKAKYANIGQHDGLEQALEIIEGNIKGDFDIDEWMAEKE